LPVTWSDNLTLKTEFTPSQIPPIFQPFSERPLSKIQATAGTSAQTVDCSGSVFLDQTDTNIKSNEFVFLVDCSGSRFAQARQSLDLFIRSLPAGCFFNIVRFGSTFESLFSGSVIHSSATVTEALRLASQLEANLGGTEILAPVEGLADATGGRSDFVSAGEDLRVKVIPQLELSLQPAMGEVSVQIEGDDGLEVSPWPMGKKTPNLAFPFFVRSEPDLTGFNRFWSQGYSCGSRWTW
jgi:hypothetical protein